jgi:hypothetical protein
MSNKPNVKNTGKGGAHTATSVATTKPIARKRAQSTPPKAAQTAKAAAKTVLRGVKNIEDTKSDKHKKDKLVRDSFIMPKSEYEVIGVLKERCLRSGLPAKKSEVLRAAIAHLAKLSDSSLARSIRSLTIIKTGRPKKNQ